LFNNNLSVNLHGITLVMSHDNTILWNRINGTDLDYGIRIESGADRNIIWNNTLIDNNAYACQAHDDGANNRWNTSGSPHGYGNYWSDWTAPDGNGDGIVDNPYDIDGTASTNDSYPLTTPSPAPPFIPEFSDVIIPIAGLMLIALVFGRTKKKTVRGYISIRTD